MSRNKNYFMPCPPAEKPTLAFIGVTTGSSSINKVFPRWAETLGLGDAVIAGMDFVPHDDPQRYREAITFIKNDPLTLGALVTTHKIDLFAAGRDLFDEIDPLAEQMGEISSIYKRDGKLHGRTVDPVNSGRALDAFLPKDHWADTGAEVCILGAGGSSLALSWHLHTCLPEGNRPSRIVVTNRSRARLDHMRKFHQTLRSAIPIEYELCPEPADNDAIVNFLAPRSLVVNATGLGKDSPGSPVTDAVTFPRYGYLWEFNYRGDLLFRDQAYAQRPYRHLTFEDGWIYFIHGWTSVIADVFNIDIPATGPQFEFLADEASLACQLE